MNFKPKCKSPRHLKRTWSKREGLRRKRESLERNPKERVKKRQDEEVLEQNGFGGIEGQYLKESR
uniref:Uncharacterized protein n=1 Tax=Cucumis sativus TaxID=3659 RepID=A0A0A0LXH4_CUCSA